MTTYRAGYLAGVQQDFPTLVSMLASASFTTGDIGELCDSTAAGSRIWAEGAITISKQVTIRGYYAGRRVALIHTFNIINCTASCTIENLTLFAGNADANSAGVTSSGTGINVNVVNCESRVSRMLARQNSSSGTMSVSNCIADGAITGFLCSNTGSMNVYNCTAVRCSVGFSRTGGALTAKNCLGAWCSTNCFSGSFAAGSAGNGSTDATAPGTSPQINLTSASINFVNDSANFKYPQDFRIQTGSSIASTGVDSGLTSDIDGQTYSGVFPVGASKGLYLPTVDTNYILSTATPAGNYVPPSVADVRPVSFGVSQTGTLANLDGTESAYQALEATRNTDPLVANVRNGTAYKIANVSKTGTLTSLATTSTPTSLAIADDGDGCAWAITAGIGANEALYLYDNSDDSLIGVFDDDCTTEDLTPGTVCYCKALAADKALSARYPGSGGVTVPSLAPVSTVDPANVVVTDDRDGTNATAVLSDSPGPTATNEIYLARYSSHGPLVFTLAGSRTGDGSVTLSPGAGQWVAQVRTTIGAATGIGLGSTFWVTSADDQRRQRMRDRTASASLRVARRMGFQIAYQSPGRQQINLWAIPETFSRSTSMLGGEVGTTVGRITVPRQADFPPYDSIQPGAKVWIDGIPYGANISWQAESEDMAPVFAMDLRRLDYSVELDDEDDIA